jgi:hypothetical protein
VRHDELKSFAERVGEEYRVATHIEPNVYVVEADDGAREETVSEPGAVAMGSEFNVDA